MTPYDKEIFSGRMLVLAQPKFSSDISYAKEHILSLYKDILENTVVITGTVEEMIRCSSAMGRVLGYMMAINTPLLDSESFTSDHARELLSLVPIETRGLLIIARPCLVLGISAMKIGSELSINKPILPGSAVWISEDNNSTTIELIPQT